jgi:hypothetical protein
LSPFHTHCIIVFAHYRRKPSLACLCVRNSI